MNIAMYLSYSSTLETFEQIIFEYIKLNNLSSITRIKNPEYKGAMFLDDIKSALQNIF